MEAKDSGSSVKFGLTLICTLVADVGPGGISASTDRQVTEGS